MKFVSSVRDTLRPDASDRVVPPTGMTARLTVFTAAAMAFLAVFALALALAAGRLAASWSDDLARGATLRITAPDDRMEEAVSAAFRVLETTPGVSDIHPLTLEEQKALLEPWFGEGLPLEDLPIPQLITFSESGAGYDSDGLRLRLQAEVPGAVLDDHRRWRAPMLAAASGLRAIGWLALVLIIGALAAMVTLAANAALAANAQVIGVLRLVGATDAYIARAFVRRFTLRALGGAAAGALAGLIAVLLLPDASAAGEALTGIGFRGAGILLPFLVPPLAAFVAFLATRKAAARVLEDTA